MKRLLAILALAGCVFVVAYTLSAHAAAPTLPCNPTTRMDTWWDEHGVQYECRCIRFPGETRPWCSWFKVPTEGRAELRRVRPRVTPPATRPAPPLPAASAVVAWAPDPYLAGDAWAQANGL